MINSDDLISRSEYKRLIDEQLRFYDPNLSPWHVTILKLQRELLDDMQSVDAIPVEWLERIASGVDDKTWTNLPDVIEYLIMAWRREQENK